MKMFMKWTGIVSGGLLGLVLLSGLILYAVGTRKLARTHPNIAVETVGIPTGADAIAQGRHIAIIWSCTRCHGADLSGTLITKDPLMGTIPLWATIPASNLTSGKGGIAKAYSDTDWVRAIRYGLKPNNRAELFMAGYFSTMSDHDLGDLIAYLKHLPPVDSDYPAPRYGPIVPIAPAIGLFTPAAAPVGHAARTAAPAPGATKEYGGYLSGLCTACHGRSLPGTLRTWSRQDFVRAIHTGALPNGRRFGPTMSSSTFSELNDTELAALWLYFTGKGP